MKLLHPVLDLMVIGTKRYSPVVQVDAAVGNPNHVAQQAEHDYRRSDRLETLGDTLEPARRAVLEHRDVLLWVIAVRFL